MAWLHVGRYTYHFLHSSQSRSLEAGALLFPIKTSGVSISTCRSLSSRLRAGGRTSIATHIRSVGVTRNRGVVIRCLTLLFGHACGVRPVPISMMLILYVQ
jgi:hypothetical protein